MFLRDFFFESTLKSDQRKAAEVTVLSLIALMVGYGFNVLLARLLDPEEYGDFSVMFKVLNIALPFFLLGTNNSVYKFFPGYFKQDLGSAKGFLKWNYRLIVRSTILALIFGVVLFLGLYYIHREMIMAPDILHPVTYAIWLVPLFMVALFQRQLIVALDRLNYAYFQNEIAAYLLFSLLLLGIGAYSDDFELHYTVIALSLGSLVLIAFQGIYILRRLSKPLKEVKASYHKTEWRSLSLRMLANGVLSYFLSAFDLLFIELFCPREEGVGVFSSILVILSVFWVVEGATSQLIVPKISSAFEEGGEELKVFKQKVMKVLRIRALITFVFLLIVIFFGELILASFGPEYVSGYPGLVIAASLLFVAITHRFASKLLQYAGYEVLNMRILFSSLIINTILNLVLIPPFHVVGVCISYGMTILYSTLVSVYFVRKKLNTKTFLV